mgnify:FL=1
MKKLLMGNEAVAYGAAAAGVGVVSGYPGTPSTEVLETVAKINTDKRIYVEWSTNEKAALEVAAGAAYAGARSMVTMKQVGLNVASDPLMSLAYVGVKGGMVVLVADDPGPLSSQTEQDTRHFARYANLPVFDPATPEEAYEMTIAAFALSEQIGKPVFVRPTTKVCHSCATIEAPDTWEPKQADGFVKDPKWVIFPPLAYRAHVEIEALQRRLSEELSDSPFNKMWGSGKVGVAAGGVSRTYVTELAERFRLPVKVLEVGIPNPFPTKLGTEFLRGLEKVIVFEELDPVIEEGLIEIAYQNRIDVVILGKKTDNTPCAGEFTYEIVRDALADVLGMELKDDTSCPPPPPLPVRNPVLCAGCPHRASFYAVKLAMKGQKAVFTGDIGCYTLGNAKPLEMTDTCLCMGAGITVAQGLKRAQPDTAHIAFVGDSTFFHTGLPGIANAVYNQTDITVIVLDNYTTAMTGHQPHPGIGKTMMGVQHGKIDIYGVVKALGASYVKKADPFDLENAVSIVKEAVAEPGVSVVIFESPCIALVKPERVMKVDADTCRACGRCVREIGCPALFVGEDKKVFVEPSLCTGCGLCTDVCPFGAIGGEAL